MSGDCRGCAQPLPDDAAIGCPACGDPIGTFRWLQVGLVVAVFAAFAAQWIAVTPFSGAGSSAALSSSAGELEQVLRDSTLAQVVVVGVALFLIGSLVVCARNGPWMLRSVRLALREPFGVPTFRRRVLMGGFLAAFFLITFGELVVVGSLTPRAKLALDGGPTVKLAGEVTFAPPGEETPRTLRRQGAGWKPVDAEKVKTWGPERIEVAALTSERAVHLRWEIAQARVRSEGGAVFAVDGEPTGDGAVFAPAGARLRVGDLHATLEGPTWAQVVTAHASGKATALGLLLLACAFLGGRELFAELGVRREGWKQELKRGFGALWAFLPAYALLVIGWTWLGQKLGIPVENHPLIQAVLREGIGLFALVAVQAVLVAPVLEELLFRGFLLSAAQRSVGKVGALLLSAGAFALVHAGFASLVPMFGLGLVFGAIRLASPQQSLLGSILAHALFNGLTLTLAFVMVA